MNLTIHTDGGARGNPGPAALGVVVYDESNEVIYERGEVIGETTNNVAEYSALIHALTWLKDSDQKIDDVAFKLDSKLVIEQVNGKWKVKEAHLQTLVRQAQEIIRALPYSVSLSYVPRAQNAAADALVNQALDAAN